MTSASASAAVVVASGLGKRLGPRAHAIQVLEDVTLNAGAGAVTALVGSDGAGKTTLIRLMAGLLPPDAGVMTVLGIDVAKDPQSIQSRIGYMPQRFGLYDDLRVRENLDLYADLHGVSAAARRDRYPALMEMTALAPFMDRLAGQLSGGMKQKLGLACTLIATPELLLLDEPTAGVDPLSRRELWQIIRGLVRDQGVPVIVSTSYLDEADACDHVVVLNRGRVLAQGAPASVSRAANGRVFLLTPRGAAKARDLQARLLAMPQVVDAVPEAGRVRVVLNRDKPPAAIADLGALQPTPASFEDGFMTLLRATAPDQAFAAASSAPAADPAPPEARPAEVTVTGLVRRFGAFTAVDNISFEVGRGEIFGLLGPNGAGKTTTFRMLCGLLPVTGGELRVGGADMRRARAAGRGRLGYVAQKFSLYGLLSVAENLDFFASVYGLRGQRKRERIDWAMAEFELTRFAATPSAQLAGGHKQRLAMAAALLHEPELLFLDEPTSGADPLARRDFWRRITGLAGAGVTVIVTTHFMAEAEYCDRIAILDSGRILAQGEPAEIRAKGHAAAGEQPNMEDAFIAIVEASRAAEAARGKAAA
ncbi:MAG TPA: ATP-binding cassette domain-containing protein [Caulobacteraceae bacterium]|nr:ATP-binding cassette domain-containing protein [Caulobacteraceae bacterium]